MFAGVQSKNEIKRIRTIDIIKDAINDGKPLPLQVMLEAMWDFRRRAAEADARQNDAEATAMLRSMLNSAIAAAPYCHPKLGAIPANQGLDPEGGAVLSAHAVMEALKGRSQVELNRAYLDAVQGRMPQPTMIDSEASTEDEASKLVQEQ
jgi:hypothetical protein